LMYEVEFNIDIETMTGLFKQARLDLGDVKMEEINSMVFNAVGAAPMKPLGFNPSYDQGARGPTPRVTPFTPERLTCTFPAYVVEAGTDHPATRHFLNTNVTRFLELCVK